VESDRKKRLAALKGGKTSGKAGSAGDTANGGPDS